MVRQIAHKLKAMLQSIIWDLMSLMILFADVWDLLKPRPRTVKSAVRYLLKGLDRENREALKALPRDELVAKCRIRGRDDLNYVPSECLLYFSE